MKLTKTSISIITKTKVDKTYYNKDAFLHATVSLFNDDEINKNKTYKVTTHLVDYEEVSEQKVDENGNLIFTEEKVIDILDNEGKVIEQEITPPLEVIDKKLKLVILEQKQPWTSFVYSYDQLDNLYTRVKDELNLNLDNLTRTQRENEELRHMFLLLFKERQPWGTLSDDWKIRTEDDFEQIID